MAAKNPETPEVSKGTEVVTRTDMEIVDNTDVVVVEDVAVEAEEVEILNGLVQVNYK